jgi:tetratricopeptide (TPR) repeat protein
MAENTQQKFMDKFDFNKIVAVLIAVITLITAVVAYWQSDAGGRDDQANRDGMRYILEAFGTQVSGDARVNFDYNKAYQAVYEYDLLANSAANRDDKVASDNYARLSNDFKKLSPLMASPYMEDKEGASPNVALYESDVYLVKITSLIEKFTAASAVKDAWDFKANTYIVHLTLLAVSLFLFGLATAISNDKTRWVFSGGGLLFALIAIIWAVSLYFQPVFDLRAQGDAIDQYSAGVGLAHQEKYAEAVSAFDKAIAAYPKYVNALTERASAQSSLGEREKSIADYESAIAAGDNRANTFGNLAYQYHLIGNFEKAIEYDRKAVTASGAELWPQFDLGLNLMASGKMDEGLAVYKQGIESAVSKVLDAKKAGTEAPSYVWYGMEDGADMLDGMITDLAAGDPDSAASKIAKPDEFKPAAEKIMYQLKSTAASLEFSGAAPEGELTATISPFTFVQPVKDDAGEVTGYSEPAESFEYGVDEFTVQFDYKGMPAGKDVLFKLYINGTEDPSWRIQQPWELGADGTADIPVSYAYSDTFVFEPGQYVVEMYVDNHLAQRGSFMIEAK